MSLECARHFGALVQSVGMHSSARWGLRAGKAPGGHQEGALTKLRRDDWKYKLSASSIKENGNDLILSTADKSRHRGLRLNMFRIIAAT